jgi:uncharacterized repeat protein (TIGR03837 family)
MPSGLLWDVFCRVVDNHGDLGVCWRLARDLAGRGERVRLWVDDASALAWMAPAGAPGVELRAWVDEPATAPGEVVVEAFGCDPPPAFVQAMNRRRPAPLWINLEYLSAEPYVERSHGLPSPQRGGLTKWFFFPGFTPRTGGLLREPGLLQQQDGFDGRAWLAARGWAARPDERVVSLFCYAPPPGSDGLALLAGPPTLVLATPGHASAWLRGRQLPEGLRVVELPWLSQPDYDRLLWSCALNAVRGEDSFVRALWAPAPLLWQIYPQHDGVHARKLDAFLDRYLQGAPPPLAAAVRQAMRHWNGLGPLPAAAPNPAAWRDWHMTWRKSLSMQDDLVTQLRRFVQGKRERDC